MLHCILSTQGTFYNCRFAELCDAYLAKVGNQVSKKFLPGMCQAKNGFLKEEPMHNFEGWSKADTIALGSLLVR